MRAIEFLVFKGRLLILALLAGFTVVMGFYALQLKMEAGFLKQVPTQHEYVQTFLKYQDEVPGAHHTHRCKSARRVHLERGVPQAPAGGY